MKGLWFVFKNYITNVFVIHLSRGFITQEVLRALTDYLPIIIKA